MIGPPINSPMRFRWKKPAPDSHQTHTRLTPDSAPVQHSAPCSFSSSCHQNAAKCRKLSLHSIAPKANGKPGRDAPTPSPVTPLLTLSAATNATPKCTMVSQSATQPTASNNSRKNDNTGSLQQPRLFQNGLAPNETVFQQPDSSDLSPLDGGRCLVLMASALRVKAFEASTAANISDKVRTRSRQGEVAGREYLYDARRCRTD